MNAVERISHYIHHLIAEPSWDTNSSIALPSSWPSKGNLSFHNVSLRYRPQLEPALKSLSLEINGGEKIGIVGRTGSGKSTIMLALFRLVDPFEGIILIDGVDILKTGLRDVRKKLAIIPQDPILFSGTIRSNLDPFDGHTDLDIWQVCAIKYNKYRFIIMLYLGLRRLFFSRLY